MKIFLELAFVTITKWAIVCFLIFLITVCFEMQFDLKVATGIWILLELFGSYFRSIKNIKKE